MDLAWNMQQLRCSAAGIEHLTRTVNDDHARWRPSPGRWSILEVLAHLYLEEQEDFRPRLDTVLHHPGRDFAALDPEGSLAASNLNRLDLSELISKFIGEREKSLAWLATLQMPSWERVYEHPAGPIRAGDIMAAWLAHDFIHIRQISRLHFEYVAYKSQPYVTRYAGDW